MSSAGGGRRHTLLCNVESLLPRAFQRGRRCRQADEGAELALKLSVCMRFRCLFMKTAHFIARTNAPSSASGTFSPPLKNAVGRRTLDEQCVCDSTLMVFETLVTRCGSRARLCRS